MQKELMDLKNDYERISADNQALNQKYNQTIVQNQKLIEQLKHFEKESFEIEARVKQSRETQKENEHSNKMIQDLRDAERELKRQLDTV